MDKKTDVEILSGVTGIKKQECLAFPDNYITISESLAAMQRARDNEVWDFCYWYRNQGKEISHYPLNEVMLIYQRFKEETK